MTQATGAAPAKAETRDTGTSPYETTAVVRHLAHELRQPLSTIESIAYYLGIILPRQDLKARQQVEKLQEVVQQAGWILSDAVHFLQASPPAPEVIDLDEFISDSVRESARGERVWIHMSLCPEPALVRLDPEQARHLLRNVLFFFWQVSKPDPSMSVRTSIADGEARIEFEAESVDCTIEDMESMFDPFSPHLPAGSGLALASVRRITEVHDGRIEFHRGDKGGMSLLIAFPEMS